MIPASSRSCSSRLESYKESQRKPANCSPSGKLTAELPGHASMTITSIASPRGSDSLVRALRASQGGCGRLGVAWWMKFCFRLFVSTAHLWCLQELTAGQGTDLKKQHGARLPARRDAGRLRAGLGPRRRVAIRALTMFLAAKHRASLTVRF